MVELHRAHSKLGGRCYEIIGENACIAGAGVSHRIQQNES